MIQPLRKSNTKIWHILSTYCASVSFGSFLGFAGACMSDEYEDLFTANVEEE